MVIFVFSYFLLVGKMFPKELVRAANQNAPDAIGKTLLAKILILKKSMEIQTARIGRCCGYRGNYS